MTVVVPAMPTPVPQRSDPINFPARADAVMVALPGIITAMNTQNEENNTMNANVDAKHATVVAYAQTIVDNMALLVDIQAEMANIILVADDIAAVVAVGTNIANVNTVAANIANINAAVADLPALAAKVSKTGDVMSGKLDVRTTGTDNMAALTPSHQLEARNDSTGAAAIRFHRNGLHAFFLGIDSANALSIGGGSMGAVKRRVYHEGNIFAAVSESGGIPTGGIIESGSGANGQYVKYADGTMTCHKTMAGPYTTSVGTGTVFQSAVQSGNWEKTFIYTPFVEGTVYGSATANCWLGNVTPSTTGFSAAVVMSGSAAASAGFTLTAHGRWRVYP